MANQDNDAIPEINIKARQVGDKAHVEVEVPVGSSEQEQKKTAQKKREAAREERRQGRQERHEAHEKEKEAKKKEREDKEDGDDSKGFTIAGYTLGELVQAPTKPPNKREVGKRSPKTDD